MKRKTTNLRFPTFMLREVYGSGDSVLHLCTLVLKASGNDPPFSLQDRLGMFLGIKSFVDGAAGAVSSDLPAPLC